jgi:hypothetical protein
MKLELSTEEAARIMAGHYALGQIRTQMAQLRELHNRHVAQQEEIEKRIRKRVKDLPAKPITEWIFNLDPVTFEGSVEIPEEAKKNGLAETT